jgi:hypothetical protein
MDAHFTRKIGDAKPAKTNKKPFGGFILAPSAKSFSSHPPEGWA